MEKKRILAGIALTAGLGLTGVATAPVSGAATPQSASAGAAHAKPAKAAPGHKGGGPEFVCVIRIGGPGGKGGGPVELPPLPPLNGKPGKATQPGKGKAGKITTVKVVNGKVYINGKPAPKGSVGTGRECPLPPLPPKGGKHGTGVVIVQRGEGGVVSKGTPGGAAGEAGLTTSGAPSTSAVLG
jgi:hypothetical protein